ncbi:sulfotransferase family protein [Sinisalibacter aestuarii]|uniref:Sulfotransferase n=1 Tax=Sinisalibacter aestuarii TaxID=2949426 RepID=A0ABQ5LWV3_9RHOB|nr:sulfotransferase [Sinisalibacter aestuarii]GKY89233.1 hypothetical protein STA1M1_31020 [Sinisalibacter aestuarii]
MIERLVLIPPVRKLSSALFHYRSNAWRWSTAFRNGREVKIDRPIFLLGTQNGGLTLLSRILHRHPNAISVSGDHRYWAGEDEAQNALSEILPEDFGWRRVDLPAFPSTNHGWVYGTDAFLPYYRRRASEVDPAVAMRYRRILQGIIRQHGGDRSVRLIDKSQTLTVRVGAVQKALSESTPRFVLISRNPWAVIWSQATRNGVVRRLNLPVEDKVRLCAEHWSNSMRAALEDADADPGIRLRHWRFEALLDNPEQIVSEICNFCGLEYAHGILPAKKDRIHLGARYDAYNKRKWYPLRPDVNTQYLSEVSNEALKIVTKHCGELAERMGYEVPQPK